MSQRIPLVIKIRACAGAEAALAKGITIRDYAMQFDNHPSRTTINCWIKDWWPPFKKKNPQLIARVLRQKPFILPVIATNRKKPATPVTNGHKKNLSPVQRDRILKRFSRALAGLQQIHQELEQRT